LAKFIFIRGMKRIAFLLLVVAMISCKGKRNIPDVSKVQAPLQTMRFEKDFFALDTNSLDAGLQQLYTKYPEFFRDYVYNILGIEPKEDSVLRYVKLFINDYKDVYAASGKVFSDFSVTEKQVQRSFQFIKYYFPKYPLPEKLVTYIGPWDALFMLSDNATGSSVMRDGSVMGIGLQLSLGKDFRIYKEQFMQDRYPEFVSAKFDPAYIPVNCSKVIIDDMFPMRTGGMPLVEQMIELGKRLYVLDMVMPETPDTLKTGYTAKQLKGCYDNEANIWSFFVTNGLVFATDPNTTKDYVSDGPKTAPLGDESPGFIGKFVGWQIVKKWMDKNPKATLVELMNKNPKALFEEAKYKP